MRSSVVVALVAGGCLRSTQFVCSDSAQCSGGQCQPTGFCSFADPSCESGQRYGEVAGDLSQQCVVGGSGSDGGPTDSDRCPGYGALGGSPHMYRTANAANGWRTHRDDCRRDGGYLAIPDDADELAAILGLANATVWVGISDREDEGTFVTVLDRRATFLPWATNEPDDQPGRADCVKASQNQQVADDDCGLAVVAVCECEP